MIHRWRSLFYREYASRNREIFIRVPRRWFLAMQVLFPKKP